MKHDKTDGKTDNRYLKALVIFSVFLVSFFAVSSVLNSTTRRSSLDSRTYAAGEAAPSWMWPLTWLFPSEQKPARSLKLSSFTIPTPSITPTGFVPNVNIPPGAIITPAIGGPNPPAGYYCIDDVDPDECDDDTSHLVPYGRGGVSGTCGKIIEQTHALVASLPRYPPDGKGIRNSLNPAVSNSCHSTGPFAAPDYISTYLVIDSFNLAGFTELDKGNTSHISPSGLFSFFQSPPAGYVYIPYSPTVIQEYGTGTRDLTGCVMFLGTGSGYHIGIVNILELYTPGGDGVLSILQSGTNMWVDRFPVTGWNVSGDSTNQTTTSGVVGFGCHT